MSDSNLVPNGLVKTQSILMNEVVKLRAQLSKEQKSASSRARMSRDVVSDLYLHAVGMPSGTRTAALLARLSPIVLAGLADKEPNDKGQSDVDPAADRKLTMYAAILEAGLSEQLLADGSVQTGGALCAATLEASLDDWMLRGRHRPGLDQSQLAKIDVIISKSAKGSLDSLEMLQTRFGVLLPCLANVHLWRLLEEMPVSQSIALGWCPAGAFAPTVQAQTEVGAAGEAVLIEGSDRG